MSSKKGGGKGHRGVMLFSVEALGLRLAKGVSDLEQSPHAGAKGQTTTRSASTGRMISTSATGRAPATITRSGFKSARGASIAKQTRDLVRSELGGADNVVAIRSDDPLVTRTVADVVERITEIVEARREALSQANIDTLIDAYLKSEPTSPARHELELDNARERARFIQDHACFTSKEIAKFAGHAATNASATATRWKKAGRIFSLPFKDGELYPAFQFAEGQPKAIIARLLALFAAQRTAWQIAFWMVSSNSWLDGAAPIDRFADAEGVIDAAEQDMGVLLG